MIGKKILDILNLLQKLSHGDEIIINDYAMQNNISPRTVRRYFEDLKDFFGEHVILKTKRGTYTSIDIDSLKNILLPTLNEKIEMEKLVELLHIINPGFSTILPLEYKKVDEKLKKELSNVFLIKGSPTENNINYKIFEVLIKAIKNRRYCKITYNNLILDDLKPLRMIYSKGNWSLASLLKNKTENNGFKILRLGFISNIEIKSKTFNKDIEAENFINNSQTPILDGYKTTPIKVIVAIAPEIKKFFMQKKFLRTQKIIDTLTNGWIKILFEVSNEEIILMLCRRWFPKMVILSHPNIRSKMENSIDNYNENKKCLDKYLEY